MILRPGLYPINGRDIELIASVLAEWCGNRNQYACYMKIPTRGPPILCRPVDEMALVMLNHVHLLPNDLMTRGLRFPARPQLSLLE